VSPSICVVWAYSKLTTRAHSLNPRAWASLPVDRANHRIRWLRIRWQICHGKEYQLATGLCRFYLFRPTLCQGANRQASLFLSIKDQTYGTPVKIFKPKVRCRAMSSVELLIGIILGFVFLYLLFIGAVEYFRFHPWAFLAFVTGCLILLVFYLKTDTEPSFGRCLVFFCVTFVIIGIVTSFVKYRLWPFITAHPSIVCLGLIAITGCFFTFMFLQIKK